MELNLVPQEADQTVFEGDGGGYYSWSTSKSPLLGEAKLGAGKLVLKPRGFALPHCADSAKIGYVLQGCCTVGMIAHNTSKENVLIINKGDVIPVPLGGVSWWFNSGDSDVVILFLGETAKAHTPGQFTYFLLAGTLGILQGFSTEFVSRAYNINEEEAHLLVNSQNGILIVKLEEGINMPQPCKDSTKEGLVANIDEAVPAVAVKNGGSLSLITSENFPVLGHVGLGASLAKLEANAMLAPMYTADSSVQMVYVSSGSGRVQMVGFNGQNVLDTKVQAGKLFVVPKFFTVSVIAEGEGMECFSILTSSRPLFEQLAGKTSVLKALSPSILQASLNVTPQFEELFKSKSERNTVIIPPNN